MVSNIHFDLYFMSCYIVLSFEISVENNHDFGWLQIFPVFQEIASHLRTQVPNLTRAPHPHPSTATTYKLCDLVRGHSTSEFSSLQWALTVSGYDSVFHFLSFLFSNSKHKHYFKSIGFIVGNEF